MLLLSGFKRCWEPMTCRPAGRAQGQGLRAPWSREASVLGRIRASSPYASLLCLPAPQPPFLSKPQETNRDAGPAPGGAGASSAGSACATAHFSPRSGASSEAQRLRGLVPRVPAFHRRTAGLPPPQPAPTRWGLGGEDQKAATRIPGPRPRAACSAAPSSRRPLPGQGSRCCHLHRVPGPRQWWPPH